MGPRQGFSLHPGIDIFRVCDAHQSAPGNSGGLAIVQDASEGTVTQSEFDITEFFDLQAAALDADDTRNVHISLRGRLSTATIASNSQPSSDARPTLTETVAHPPLDSVKEDDLVRSRVPLVEGKSAAACPPLQHWPFQHFQIRVDSTPTAVPGNFTQNINTASSATVKRKASNEACGNTHSGHNTGVKPTRKKKKLTDEELESAKKVRAQRACLRCYVQKTKCSEGHPCTQCRDLFNRAYGRRILEWTACVTSNLPDVNIFTLGVSLFDKAYVNPIRQKSSSRRLDAASAVAIYDVVIELGRISGITSQFDSWYTEVMGYIYGHRAPEVHPFILQERTPIHMLIQLNVILLGSPIIGDKLMGYVGYLQSLRAICGIVTFESLAKALNRETLATASPIRRLALILQTALLLDQVVETKEQLPAASVCFAHGRTFTEMHQHLVQYISYYLRKLLSNTFGEDCAIVKQLTSERHKSVMGEDFWKMLSDLVPIVPLRKPPKLRTFADMSWRHECLELEILYQKIFSSSSPFCCK